MLRILFELHSEDFLSKALVKKGGAAGVCCHLSQPAPCRVETPRPETVRRKMAAPSPAEGEGGAAEATSRRLNSTKEREYFG